MLFSLPAIASQLEIDITVASRTLFYCGQDVSLLRPPTTADSNVFFCEQDLSLLRTPTFSINTVAGDDSIQYPENTSPVTISGTITYIAPNTSITVNANGVNYFTTATYTDKYLTSFSVDIPSADILLWDTSETITVSVTKDSIVYSATKVVTYPAPVITINTVAGDDIIQYPENISPITISGTVDNIIPGATVTVNINGVDYSTTATYSSGSISNFSVNIPNTDVVLWDTSETITVSVTRNSVVYSATKLITYPETQLPSLFFTPQKIWDPYYTNDVLVYLKGDELNGINLVDSSIQPKTTTVQGAVSINNSIKKYGAASIYFTGATDDGVYIDRSSYNLSFAADFTVEFWVHPTQFKANKTLSLWFLSSSVIANNEIALTCDTTYMRIKAFNNTAGTLDNTLNIIPLNTWTHIAASRINSSIYIFINGVNISYSSGVSGSGTRGTSTSYMMLGYKHTTSTTYDTFVGYIDSFRVTNNIGKYNGISSAGNFNPETDTYLAY